MDGNQKAMERRPWLARVVADREAFGKHHRNLEVVQELQGLVFRCEGQGGIRCQVEGPRYWSWHIEKHWRPRRGLVSASVKPVSDLEAPSCLMETTVGAD